MLFDICMFSVLFFCCCCNFRFCVFAAGCCLIFVFFQYCFFVVVIFGFVYLQPDAVGYLYFFSIVSRKKLMNEKDIFFCLFVIFDFVYLQLDAFYICILLVLFLVIKVNSHNFDFLSLGPVAHIFKEHST